MKVLSPDAPASVGGSMPSAPAVVADVPRPPSRMPLWPLIIAAAAIGTVIIGYSYRLSSHGGAPNLYYGTFWLGALLLLLPSAVVGIRAVATPGTRFTAVVLLGALTLIPKYLRNPDGPLYHDEYSHWRQAIDTEYVGKILQPNWLIPIVQYFPGTAGLTVAGHTVSGASMWASGQAVVGLMHIIGIAGVYVLVRAHTRSDRAAGIGAVVYAINPSSLHFDVQYAYESVAINIFIWVLVFGSLAMRAGEASAPRLRWGYVALALLAAAACVVTHHLSTVFLVAALVVITSTLLVRRLRNRLRRTGPATTTDSLATWAIITLGTCALAGLWVSTVARKTIRYLEPYFGGSVTQLSDMATKDDSKGREILAASVQPLAERGAAALAPALLALITAYLLYRIVKRRTSFGSAATYGFVAYGLIYFLSVPFVLAPSGAEGARRSWGFTYIGLVIIVATVGITAAAHYSARRWWPAAIATVIVLLVGNVAGGLNDPYRFPGPFRWGTDTNSWTPEAQTVGEEMFDSVGQVRVIADGYTALSLIAYGRLVVGQPASGFQAWNLTQTNTDPDLKLAGELYSSGFEYLIFDDRIAGQPPFNGSNYGPGDPLMGQATPHAYLDRLDRVPWARRVMTTDHIRVYRLDILRIGKALVGGKDS